jgi:predicted ATP-grasp superfamily ATP-dependent carboligase
MKPTAFILEGNFLGLEMARELRDAGYGVAVVGYKKSDISIRAKNVKSYVLPLPQDDSSALLAGLIKIAREIPGEKVLTGASEGFRRWMSQNEAELLKHFRMLSCPLEVITAMFDKWNQLQMSVAAGIAVPKSSILDENNKPARKIRYPVVIKPRFSQKTIGFRDNTGQKVIIAHNQQQLETACRKMTDLGFSPLLQELIPGLDFSQFLFGAAVKDGKPYAVCLAQKVKTDPRPYGSGVIIRTIYHQELYEAGCKLLADTGYSGICDIEFMRNWDTGQFEFIEFNPRYGLGQRVSQVAGAGLPEMAVRLAMGETPEDMVIARPGYFWVYFDEWIKERVMPWRNRFTRQLRNRGNTARIFDIGDPKPELRHIRNIVNMKLTRMLQQYLQIIIKPIKKCIFWV